jgi:acetyl-CoA acetyltransferase
VAAKNPRATFRTPITVEDVPNSWMIAYPFRLLECCLVTDGGGALILVATERAATSPKPGLPPRHWRERRDPNGQPMQDFTSLRAFRVAGPTALADAGITYNGCSFMIRKLALFLWHDAKIDAS